MNADEFLSLRLDGAAPTARKPRQARATDTPDKARGVAQNMAQGLGFGLTDELTAGAVALASQFTKAGRAQGIGNVFDETLEAERAEMARNNEALGLGGVIGSQVAGGLLTGGLVASALRRASARLATTGAQTLSRAATAGATPFGQGAIEGGIAGFGASEGGTQQRLIDAAQGAAVGAGTAGLVSGVGRGLGGMFPEDAFNVPTVAGRTVGDMADTLGIRISPSSRTGNAAGSIGESALQRSAVTRSMFNADIAHNMKQVPKMILRRFGLSGDRIDGAMLNKIKGGINSQYDEIGREMADAIALAPVDVAQRDAMTAIFAEVSDSVDDMVNPARMTKALDKVQNAMSGTKDKTVVMDTLNWLRKRASNAYKNGEITDAEGLSELEDLITMAAADANPAIAVKLRAARAAWRDFKVIDTPSVTKAATGMVNPVTMANLLNRSKFTRSVFGAADELDNEVLNLGRLVQQLDAATGDPGLMFGLSRGSFTPQGQSFNPGQAIGNVVAGAGYAAGRVAGPRATNRALVKARQVAPRVAGMQVSERKGDR